MGRFVGKKPSPAMVVAVVALVFAVAGTAIAGVATVSVLSKKEKKQTKNIVRTLAPGLSVANAGSLGGTPRSDFYSAAEVDARQSRAAEKRSVGEQAFSSASPLDRISVQITAPRAGFAFVVASGNVHPTGTVTAGHQCNVEISVPQTVQTGRVESFSGGDTSLEYENLVNSWVVPVDAGQHTFTLHLGINTNVSTNCNDSFNSSSSTLNAVWVPAAG
jgi:hypothetical protein